MANFLDSLISPEKIENETSEVSGTKTSDKEKKYLEKIRKKNKNYLIKLDSFQRERVAKYIMGRHEDALPSHNEICDKIDEYDEIWRMEPVATGQGEETPKYRTPLSMVNVEVLHANIMNIVFGPKDPIRVLPTEPNDVPKIEKLSTFANWSGSHELELFKNLDRLWHYSNKCGECPYIVHWVKEYAVDVRYELIMSDDDPLVPKYDEETKEPMFREIEEPKLVYNGPKCEPFSRKDYIQPRNAVMDKLPDWEMRIVRLTYDEVYRMELEGKVYQGSVKNIKDWMGIGETTVIDYEGMTVPAGAWTKEFIEFYGRMRINTIKDSDETEIPETEELEDEFIALVEKETHTLCQLRKNKFPMKKRPIGLDYCFPDDTGRRAGLGIVELLKDMQNAYDGLFNQFLFGVVQSNSPTAFSDPTGNLKDERVKIQTGYMNPVRGDIKFLEIPAPDQNISLMLELILQWAQLMFGVSDYSAGIESRIDPSAPGKKAEVVLAQGNVRLNLILKRKLETLRDIMQKWFLLYQRHMPPNKYIRIVGDSKENPWKFESIDSNAFSLNAIPDFEFVGNVLNTNKTLEVNKRISIYQLLSQNVFFSAQTIQGLRANLELTRWLIDGLEESGLSNFLPQMPGADLDTPEEENAKFLQGEYGEPAENEDHIDHIVKHRKLLLDPTVPNEIKKNVLSHINSHVTTLQRLITQQLVISQLNPGMNDMGMDNDMNKNMDGTKDMGEMDGGIGNNMGMSGMMMGGNGGKERMGGMGMMNE